MRGLVIILSAVCLCFFMINQADALLIWDWRFDEDVFNVGAEEAVDLKASLDVDPSSDENLIMAISSFGPDSEFYDYEFIGVHGMVFEPGDSHDFVLGKVVPKSAVPVGTTVSRTALMAADSPGALNRIERSWTINVVSESTVIPEPATVLLFGLGLAGAVLMKRKLAK